MAKQTKSKKQPRTKPNAPVETGDVSANAAEPGEVATSGLPETQAPERAANTVAESTDGASTETQPALDAEPSVPDAVAATEPVAAPDDATESAAPETAPEASATDTWGAVDTAAPAATPDEPGQPWSDDATPEDSTPSGDAEPASEFAGVWQRGEAGDGTPAEAQAETTSDEASDEPPPEAPAEGSRLEMIIESLLFAADKPLSLNDLRRLLGERDGKKITAAVQALMEQRKGTGIEVIAFSSGWHLRTNPEHATWVSRLLAGKPVRLSRAMMETLAIVAYRQPVTRPEIDDIRGVDCGPVLRTLLDRGLIRIIGKKEEVGRPMLYGTTPEFLRVFNLRDLSELPTLREFYELSAEDKTRVESQHGPEPETPTTKPEVALGSITRSTLAPEEEDADPLLDELDEASLQAKHALGELEPAAEETAPTEEDAPPSGKKKAEEELSADHAE
jgi:segregation and condensation protein B